MSSVNFLMSMRKLMNIKRYQNRFRFIKTTIADHEWNVAKIAYWIAKTDEELFDYKNIDYGELLKKALHHDTMKFYGGDIQSNEGNSELIKYVRTIVYPMLFNSILKPMIPSEHHLKYEGYIVNSMDNTYLGNVVYIANKIDKLLEADDEINLGNKEYFRGVKLKQYKMLVDFLTTKTENISVSAKYIVLEMLSKEEHLIQKSCFDFMNQELMTYKNSKLHELENFKMFLKFFKWSRELIHTERYQNLTKLVKRNVSAHEWSVGRISSYLALHLENEINVKIDYEKLLLTSLEHDSIESSTGDFLSHIKRITPEMMESIEAIEKVTFETVVKQMLPEKWIQDFSNAILNPKDGTLEGDIIVMADALDVIFECYEEIKLGNKQEFMPILFNNVLFLKKFNYTIIQNICSEIETQLIYGI